MLLWGSESTPASCSLEEDPRCLRTAQHRSSVAVSQGAVLGAGDYGRRGGGGQAAPSWLPCDGLSPAAGTVLRPSWTGTCAARVGRGLDAGDSLCWLPPHSLPGTWRPWPSGRHLARPGLFLLVLGRNQDWFPPGSPRQLRGSAGAQGWAGQGCSRSPGCWDPKTFGMCVWGGVSVSWCWAPGEHVVMCCPLSWESPALGAHAVWPVCLFPSECGVPDGDSASLALFLTV